MNLNKRGLSEIVTSLIVILLVFVAVGIIWFVVQNVLNEGSEEIENLDDFTLNLEIQRVVDTGGQLSVTVYRGSGTGQFTGLRFAIFDGTNTEIRDWNGTLTELQTITVPLDYTGTYQSITMAPTLTTSTGDFKIGQVKDTSESGGTTSTPTCGDGTCNGIETCSSCVSDCGACPPVGPIISNFFYNTTYIIYGLGNLSWNINENSNSTLEYGETTSYTLTPIIFVNYATHHEAILNGLTLGTTYHYRITACSYTTELCTTTPDYTFIHQA